GSIDRSTMGKNCPLLVVCAAEFALGVVLFEGVIRCMAESVAYNKCPVPAAAGLLPSIVLMISAAVGAAAAVSNHPSKWVVLAHAILALISAVLSIVSIGFWISFEGNAEYAMIKFGFKTNNSQSIFGFIDYILSCVSAMVCICLSG
ncbi:hypothetical protein PMAYCL1PPCAC_11158, partial [Pristionchus mayeri]